MKVENRVSGPSDDSSGVGYWASMIRVGRVARIHGRLGELVVDSSTDFLFERFSRGSVLFGLRDGKVEEYRVSRFRFHRGRPLIALEGVSDFDAAERMRGVELRIPEDALYALPADVFYEHELVGCAVRTVDGSAIGEVKKVEAAGGVNRLIVMCGTFDIDVPLVDAICIHIDITARLVIIDPPAGLIGLNRTEERTKTPSGSGSVPPRDEVREV